MTETCILVVDDEPEIRRLVKEILEDEQYQVVTAENATSAREAYANERLDLVLLDIWMPDTDGISLLKEWSRSGTPDVPVVMMSGHGTVDTAVEATRLGASDFIEKPLSMGKLLVTVERALQRAQPPAPDTAAARGAAPVSIPVGKSAAMQRLRDDIERVAATESCVLITGEPGSGKSIAALYLHYKSARSRQPIVEISFAAIPAEEVPIQLFGHRRGNRVFPGHFEQARGGTLVLDDIADLDPAVQPQLLRALEERRFERVGSDESFELDVRVIATSSHDLQTAVSAGRLRDDVYYYLNVVPILIPPLREHPEDVPELINFYCDWMVEHEQLPYRKFSTSAMNQLRNYTWPGNTQELKNMVERLLILNRGVEISADEVERALFSQPAMSETLPEAAFMLPLRAARDQFEKAYLEYHLKRTNGNVSELATVADMERTHLYRKLKSLGVNPKSVRTK
ncbi:MAG: sigma-54 dependent transcriptional regulator [Gammaproteobacteria bacterium]|nr:MAG: sigma-54 dependent transcriptional regulator [Gammaproteobacteria bacterium]